MIRQYLCLLLLAALFVVSHALPLDGDEVEKISNCKDLCGKCNCLGFYCGEECLCECDGEGDEDGECIEKIQETCERMKMPFEVLIQGNSGNRLVRSLFADPQAAAENDGVCIAKDPQSRLKRNTVSIYKPKSSVGYDSSDNLQDVQQLLTEFEEDLNDESFGLKRKRNADGGAPPPPPPPPPPPAAPPAPPASNDPDVGISLPVPVTTADVQKPLTHKEVIAASLDALNKKLLSDIAANKVILAKQADEIKSKVTAAFDDVKQKASQIVSAAAPAVAAAAPPAPAAPAAAPAPNAVPAFDIKKIDFSKLTPDWAKNLALPKLPEAPGPIVQPPGTID